MASMFGDDGVDDLFNDNIANDNEDELPSDGEANAGENLFGDDEDAPNADGAVEEGVEAVKVEPKKRAVRNPRPRLTVDTLRGPRGLHTMEHYFKDIKYKGKGHEKADLDEILRRLQHWGHRMYPNYTFDDVLNNIERLGKKKPLQVHMARYRMGQLDDLLEQQQQASELHDNANDEDNDNNIDAEPFDEFDALLGEQIAMSKLAPRTPAAVNRHNNLSTTSSSLVTPSFSRNAIVSTPYSTAPPGQPTPNDNISDYGEPLPATPILSAEQMARIAENRRLAQERLRAKQIEALPVK
ncbi:protein TIPIN homolog [Drosophila grimshawi]|uniref:TIMELESS-interacting protein n=1 Tax=Drosophila grimshawi TaxID=7222 RepID=B4JBY8_DROGR|nr:protein TIPIN homolog [Drosophila grimshawi]EDW04091.1 GH11605 [Drosophila grimshawi]